MKKIVLSVIAILLFGAMANAQTQRNCEAILRDYFAVSGHDPETYPEGKAEWRCLFSSNAFYLTDEITNDGVVFLFSELTNRITGEHPAANTPVDLNTFSYYTYNFLDFQAQYYHSTIFFQLEGNTHRYLAVRCWDETFDRTENPEKYIK